MKIFVSWSGSRGGAFARELKSFILDVIPVVTDENIFLSQEIEKGLEWKEKIKKSLDQCEAVIVVLTDGYQLSPWLYFEAGAISNKKNVFIYNVDGVKLPENSPFTFYQDTVYSQSDTCALFSDISILFGNHKSIENVFNKFWPDFVEATKTLSSDLTLQDKIKIESEAITREVVELLNTNKNNVPFSSAFYGWYSAIIEEVIKPAKSDSFVVSSKFYHYCLDKIYRSDVKNIKALADMSNNDVTGVVNSNDDYWSGVEERIFYIQWEDMFDNQFLNNFVSELNVHVRIAKKYKSKIYIVSSHEVSNLQVPDISDKGDTAGVNMFYSEPSLIGCYISKGGQNKYERSLLLRATKVSSPHMKEVKDYFSSVKRKAIEIFDGENVICLAHDADLNDQCQFTVNGIKNIWVSINNYGSWNSKWSKRLYEGDYCSNYDINIKIWTPYYEKLLDGCSVRIQNEITKHFRCNGNEQINVLEVGYGTGALTEKVLDGVKQINSPSEVYNSDLRPPVSSYYGTDSSEDMETIARNRLNNVINSDYYRNLNMKFFSDEFNLSWDKINNVHVVFGSLILHLLFRNRDKESISEVFRHISDNILGDFGSMIFLYTSFTTGSKEDQLSYWKHNMIMQGLHEDGVEEYLTSNKSMTNPIEYGDIKEIADELNLRSEEITIIDQLPFKLLILSRYQSAIS